MLIDDAEPEPAAIEAPFIFRKGDYHYLFVSWDHCCRGVNSDYKVAVGRARTLRGPYVDADDERMDKGGGTVLIAGNERWPGIGHNSVYTFDGRDYFVSHAYDANDAAGPSSRSSSCNGMPTDGRSRLRSPVILDLFPPLPESDNNETLLDPTPVPFPGRPRRRGHRRLLRVRAA